MKAIVDDFNKRYTVRRRDIAAVIYLFFHRRLLNDPLFNMWSRIARSRT